MHIIFFIIGSLVFDFGIQTTNQLESQHRLNIMADSAYTFCKENDLNTNVFLLIDMKIHSGKKRFFIYDYKTKTTIKSSLCSHGCGDSPWGLDETKDCPVFSNVAESHCSSLGKYRVGKRGYSNWGIKVNYKLHGLDSSNSNALARAVVLHSWYDIPEEEIYPVGTAEGWGCPAVSNEFMTALDPILTKSKKDVLLWIYY